ncbi:hypothetical protein MPSEU_000615400 [Mayamaea pseudoterrestris]|nr:hypothetical protein MPSEU_000615400 [Mayamaea pseudoterrestris]
MLTPLLSVALLSVPTLKSLTHSPRQQQELGHQRRSTILHSTSSTTRPERNNEETSRRLQYNSLDKAAVTIIEPQTNVQVILLGCFHGSQSSARDVQALLVPPRSDEKHTLPTKAVVLELCASRFLSLRKGMEQEEDAMKSDDDFDEAMQQQEEQPWMTRYVRMVSKVSKSQGVSTGIASALLGLASGWQTAMAGLEPGLEFKTALLHNPEGSDVILADQSVDETLYKLGNLPATFLEL